MVEDNEIKAQVSPFAIREGEIKTFDGKDGYVSMNQIVHKINIGHITDIHFAILDLVNEFEFITSRQIYQMLEIKGIDPKSQDKLNNKLDALVKSKILTRYYFNSDEVLTSSASTSLNRGSLKKSCNSTLAPSHRCNKVVNVMLLLFPFIKLLKVEYGTPESKANL